ncbi:hypothetical protein INR49_026480 [Caranx melampygus]|nr:hypothetical protein INR49_026480 [Caranx melampygus]
MSRVWTVDGHGETANFGQGCSSYSTLKAWLPILSWLPRYKLRWLQMDLLAGLTVGLTTVPQALAYAEVAGLPVQYGLYSAFMGGFIYTLLGTSKDVTLGPTAIMSLLCFSVVGGQPHRAVLLSLLCGLIQAVMALLRLGFLLDFISFPVIKGFTCAAAVTIGFGQVKNILGLKDIPHQFYLEVYYTFYKIPEARIGDVVLGLLCLGLLVMLMFMKMSLGSGDGPPFSRIARNWCGPSLPVMRNALVVVAASIIAFSWDAYGYHVFTITGEISQGLPPFRPPPTSDTTSNGTIVSFGEILEQVLVWQHTSQNDYRIDANQELLAIGVTNIMGSFVSAYPVTGSFGRTAVNSQTGVCTPAGGSSPVSPDSSNFGFATPPSELDLLPFMVTFLMSFWQVQYGIIGGVAVSGVLLLYNTARPQIKLSDHGVLVMELSSGLSFPATEYVSHFIHTQALQASPPRSVVLDCHHVSVIDYTVVSELRDLLRQFKLREVQLVFCRLQPSVLEVLLAADLEDLKHTHSMDAALHMLSGNCLDDRHKNWTLVLSCDSCNDQANCLESQGRGDTFASQGFTCVCKDGFVGDGLTCYDTKLCSDSSCCSQGYDWSAERGCVDIDECSLPDPPCAPAQVCENTPGSFICGEGSSSPRSVPSPQSVQFICGNTICPSGRDCIRYNGTTRCVDPCDHYTVLDDDWRSVNNTMNNILHCDRDVHWQGWYRLFLGQESAHIPERCVEKNRCGTHAPLWITQPHPTQPVKL